MTDKLPPLPESLARVESWDDEYGHRERDASQDYYTADQMRTYAQEAARQEREECADVVECEQTGDFRDRYRDSGLRLAAAAIRARSSG